MGTQASKYNFHAHAVNRPLLEEQHKGAEPQLQIYLWLIGALVGACIFLIILVVYMCWCDNACLRRQARRDEESKPNLPFQTEFTNTGKPEMPISVQTKTVQPKTIVGSDTKPETNVLQSQSSKESAPYMSLLAKPGKPLNFGTYNVTARQMSMDIDYGSLDMFENDPLMSKPSQSTSFDRKPKETSLDDLYEDPNNYFDENLLSYKSYLYLTSDLQNRSDTLEEVEEEREDGEGSAEKKKRLTRQLAQREDDEDKNSKK